MVVWTRWGNMVSGLLGEDLGKVGIFQQEGDLGFCLFCGNGELYCCSKFGDNRRV